jgi:mannitol-1-phosphate 5-dehydrogenase
MVGIAETSIGKMVPIMRQEDLASDPLLLYAEEYENLILDKTGFLGPLPDVKGLMFTEHIAAFVDRKLFIHNLGHAAAAYLGFRSDSSRSLLPDALSIPGVEAGARKAMEESARALLAEYPGAYTAEDLNHHIDDLLFRFKNRALGDTVHRVGRDLPRKLSRDDRITGAMLLAAKHGLPFDAAAEVYRAALEFAAPDEQGRLFPEDERFRAEILPLGRGAILKTVSALDPAIPADSSVIAAVTQDPA